MKRISTKLMLLVRILSLVLLQSCALDQPLVKSDLASLSPLKVVRYNTPEITKQMLDGR